MNGPDSPLFRAVARFLFFVINVLAIHLLLRGHNLPGGGFVGGLASAISLVLLSLAEDLDHIHRLVRVDPVRVAAAGLGIAGLTGLAPVLAGAGFLEHFSLEVDLPLVGEIHTGTALLFDVGVYLAVVGVTVKIVFVLARSTGGLPSLEPEEQRRYSSLRETPIEDSPAARRMREPRPKEDRHAD